MKEMIWSDTVIGKVYSGRKGKYKITKILPGDKFLAKYVSGDWEGRTIEMRQQTHQIIQREIGFDLKNKKLAAERVLDTILETWYERFEALYMDVYRKGISDQKLLELLEEKYPTAASVVQELCG